MSTDLPAEFGKPIHITSRTSPRRLGASGQRSLSGTLPAVLFGHRVESEWKVGRTVQALATRWTPTLAKCLWPIRRECSPSPGTSSGSTRFASSPAVVVSYKIDALGGVVRLTTVESHPTPIDEKYYEGGRRGWPVILSGLKTLLKLAGHFPISTCRSNESRRRRRG
jgi:hypothetical protein